MHGLRRGLDLDGRELVVLVPVAGDLATFSGQHLRVPARPNVCFRRLSVLADHVQHDVPRGGHPDVRKP
jgi:hypothetical protein